MSTALASVAAAFQGKKRVLVAAHVNPDGDAVGATLACAHVSLALGSDVRIFFCTGYPGYLSWLSFPCPWVHTLEELEGWVPDLLVIVDCGDVKRTGDALAAYLTKGVLPTPLWENTLTVNIDHHKGNPEFATVNWVEPDRAATGEMVGMVAEHLGMRLAGELGLSVYLSLVSDTGNFSFSNTSADVLSMAARIVENGLNVGDFSAHYENNWSLAQMHLWGKLFNEVTLHYDGAVACSIVPRSYLENPPLHKSTLEGFASWLRKIEGVKVGLFIREDAPGLCKVSLRSTDDVDVREVAAQFGGGGHARAAGAEVSMEPSALAAAVLAKLGSALSH